MSKKNERTEPLVVVDMPLPNGNIARLVSNCQVGIAILTWILVYNLWIINHKYANALRTAEELYLSECRS